jgi:hypothetical protein
VRPLSQMTSSQFARHQQQRRRELWKMLGDLPAPRRPKARLLKTVKGKGCTVEHLELDLNGVETVPARLLIPDKRKPKAPGLIYIHAHGGTYGLGKEELFKGREQMQAYAPVCVEKGIVALTIDSWCFSGRKHLANGGRGESDTFKLMLWKGQTLWGMMMFDEVQALNYLVGRPEVDAGRIGTLGLSMGSTKAWWLAALDPRIKLCIALCCLTDFEHLVKEDYLRGHGIYFYTPGLLKHFQTHEITELIVPRAHLNMNGRTDPLTPPKGVERIRDHLMPIYRRFGRARDCAIQIHDCGHLEIPAMRTQSLKWLDCLVDGKL